jgi:DNA-binding beta-propeller fold protein YncE
LRRVLSLALVCLAGCYDLHSLSDEYVPPDMSATADGGDTGDGGGDLSASVGGVALLAGGLGGAGALDGVGSVARFHDPVGLAYDASGVLYVAEYSNSTLRSIDVASATVTRIAGQFTQAGSADGPVSTALLSRPVAIAVSGQDLFISDVGSARIRLLSGGELTTLLGGVTSYGMTMLGGVLYYSDSARNQLFSVATSPDGGVGVPKVFSGNGTAAIKSGTPSVAEFDAPTSLIPQMGGGFIVVDQAKNVLRLVDAGGNVSATTPSLPHPSIITNLSPWYAIVADGTGSVYVADAPLDEIDRVPLPLTTGVGLVGRSGGTGSADGNASTASFSGPDGIAWDGANTLFVADRGNQTIRRIAMDTLTTSTLAGTPPQLGAADSMGAAARFNSPLGLAWNPSSSSVYVADFGNRRLRAVTLDGSVSTLIVGGDTDAAVLPTISPAGVALDGAGNLYFTDLNAHVLYVVDGTGNLTVLAGKVGISGSSDGTGSAAAFYNPRGLAFDPKRNVLYVADQTNGRVRVVTLDGQVTTLSARFGSPMGVAYDPTADELYVADTNNHAIQGIQFTNNTQTLIAGVVGVAGSSDGPVATALFHNPRGLALDGAGNLYVADTGNSTIRKLDLVNGAVTTLAGVAGEAGASPGPLPARLNTPEGIVWVPGFGLIVSMQVENALVSIR